MASFGSSRKARGRQDSQQRSSSLFRLYPLTRGRKDSFEEVGGRWPPSGAHAKQGEDKTPNKGVRLCFVCISLQGEERIPSKEVGGKWVSFGSSRKARGRQDLYKELACFCMDLLPRSEMNRFKEVGGRCAAQASITAGRRRYDKEKSGE